MSQRKRASKYIGRFLYASIGNLEHVVLVAGVEIGVPNYYVSPGKPTLVLVCQPRFRFGQWNETTPIRGRS